MGSKRICLEYKLKCFSSRRFCLGLNATVTLCLRLNAFEFPSIQQSAPCLKPAERFCVVLTKWWIQNGLTDYLSAISCSRFTRRYTQSVIKRKKLPLRWKDLKPSLHVWKIMPFQSDRYAELSIKYLIRYYNMALGSDPKRIKTFTLIINHSKWRVLLPGLHSWTWR